MNTLVERNELLTKLSPKQIYNLNNKITYHIFETNDLNDIRIEKRINNVWKDLLDGNWNMTQAKQKLFELQTGMTKKHYNSIYKN
jgi:hypothetical protein